jgi:hypothetical protein
MSVEGFISKLNHVMFDPHRRALSSDHVEDTLRVVQNGSPPDVFDAREVAPLWTEIFGHNHVKSQKQKLESLARNKKGNARKRHKYATDAEYHARKKKLRTEQYLSKKLVLTIGRGLLQPAVRKSLKAKRSALRAKPSQQNLQGDELQDMSEESHTDDSQSELEADMQPVLDTVKDVLGASNVELQLELNGNKISKRLKHRYFLFHDGDHSIQLAHIKRVYGQNCNKKAFQKGMTIEAKFWNARGKQDVALLPADYDPQLEDVRGWVLLIVDMGNADVVRSVRG